MWPFSETNAAAMRTLKTPVYAESSARSGGNTFGLGNGKPKINPA
jgi:hypothetical protein